MSNPCFDPLRKVAAERRLHRVQGRRIVEQKMPILQSIVKTYEFKPDELKELIAADLKLDPKKVKLEFVLSEAGDERFGGTWKVVSSVKVTVEGR